MIKFNALEKIVDQVRVSLNIRTRSPKKIIKNKNSPNYGTQTIADTVTYKTDLSHKTNADIRKLEIISTGPRAYKMKAVYVDGSTDENFQGHWYGWQHGGRGLVWTPLGQSNSLDLGQSRFAEISAWVNPQDDDKNANNNVSGHVGVGDKPW